MESYISNRIAYLVWNRLKSRDIRDCIKIGRLSTNVEDVNLIVNTLKQYKNNVGLS
jgi:Holliday junction DNA helicase RuvB